MVGLEQADCDGEKSWESAGELLSADDKKEHTVCASRVPTRCRIWGHPPLKSS